MPVWSKSGVKESHKAIANSLLNNNPPNAWGRGIRGECTSPLFLCDLNSKLDTNKNNIAKITYIAYSSSIESIYNTYTIWKRNTHIE
jgi:hypothetical protein